MHELFYSFHANPHFYTIIYFSTRYILILLFCYKQLCFFQILPVHTDRILIQFLCIYISRHSMSIETSYSCALIRACCMCFIPNLIIRKYITDTIVLCHICPLINCFPVKYCDHTFLLLPDRRKPPLIASRN